eukprot:5346869-Prymnesium_polylepis.1
MRGCRPASQNGTWATRGEFVARGAGAALPPPEAATRRSVDGGAWGATAGHSCRAAAHSCAK